MINQLTVFNSITIASNRLSQSFLPRFFDCSYCIIINNLHNALTFSIALVPVDWRALAIIYGVITHVMISSIQAACHRGHNYEHS